ncbi:hypothetical protein Goshw_016360 [Gossypium schwendimanii]|uniref:Uncharacterized protein n=1 Tax=Gossypium schwendimanii TaxID=34291 RepID=A0A7J9LWA3_GOSSC|nr:hypothetical protein [Gossypium schwendimanii]
MMIFENLILIIEKFRNSFANSTRSFHLKYGLLQMSLLHGILGQHNSYHEEILKSQYEDKDEDFNPDAYYDALQMEIYQKK